jgi:hypothetical protein
MGQDSCDFLNSPKHRRAALTGHVKFANLIFTEPNRNTSLVTNVSFSAEREE